MANFKWGLVLFYALLLLTVFRAESSFNAHKSQRGENLKKMDRGGRCQLPGGMVRAMSKKIYQDGIAKQIGPFPILRGQENQSLYQA